MSPEVNKSDGTTIWADKHTKMKLACIATVLQRSMAAQVRFLVDREYDRLQKEGHIGTGVLAELKKEVEG